MVITSTLPYLPLLGMKRWLKLLPIFLMGSAGNKHMFRYNFYESRLNILKVIVIIPLITPIYPIITPISGTNTRGILEDL